MSSTDVVHKIIIKTACEAGIRSDRMSKISGWKVTPQMKQYWNRRPHAVKRGVKKGSTFIKDSAIMKVVGPLTERSCRFTAKGDEVRTIQQSFRKLWMTCKALRNICSLRTLYKRLHKCRLGVSRGKKWTDVCATCLAWDMQVSKIVENSYDEAHDTLQELVPRYWADVSDKLDQLKQEYEDHTSYLEQVQYAEVFVDYVKKRNGETLYGRAGWTPEKHKDVTEAEAGVLALFSDKIVPLLREWSCHWVTRDIQLQCLDSLLTSSRPGQKNIFYDAQDTRL